MIMKRLIAGLLCIILLVGLFPTTASASGSNFILPCENARERYVVKGHIMLLNYIMCQYGPSGQYAVFNIYRGTSTIYSNYIETYYAEFDNRTDLANLYLDLKTKNYSYGTYTIEYFVSWSKVGHYSTPTSARFRTTFEVVASAVPLTGLGLVNDDTSERYPSGSKIAAAKGDSYTFTTYYEPKNSTTQQFLTVSSSDPSIAKFEKNTFGELELKILKTGNATLTVECDGVKSTYYIEPRCEHSYQLSDRIEPTCDKNGKEVYECTSCGHSNTISLSALGHNKNNGICTRCGYDLPFDDMTKTDWFYDSVKFAYNNNLFNGTSSNAFSPNKTMTRAMLVTVLWRYAGSPDVGNSTFSDVKSDAYYAKAVAWASSTNVVNGVGNNRFNPDGTITREQMATILYRYAQNNGYSTDITGNLSAFPDGNTVSSYAVDALSWAVGMELINGSNGKLLPQNGATRAQVAAILMRFIENCYPI